jgi:hypothetical protein
MKIPESQSAIGHPGLRWIKRFDYSPFKFRRVARIFAEVVRYGTNNDAHNFSPRPLDRAVRCLKTILNDAQANLSRAFRRFND